MKRILNAMPGIAVRRVRGGQLTRGQPAMQLAQPHRHDGQRRNGARFCKEQDGKTQHVSDDSRVYCCFSTRGECASSLAIRFLKPRKECAKRRACPRAQGGGEATFGDGFTERGR